MKNISNNMRTFNSKVLLSLAIIFAVSFTLSAQPPKAKKGSCAGTEAKQRGPLAGIPDVTDKQKAEIKDLFKKHREQVQLTQLDLEQKRLDLKKLTVTDKTNTKALDAKVDEIYALKASLVKSKNKLHNDIRNVLTDEQKAIYDMKLQRAKKGHKGGNKMAQRSPHGKQMHNGKGKGMHARPHTANGTKTAE